MKPPSSTDDAQSQGSSSNKESELQLVLNRRLQKIEASSSSEHRSSGFRSRVGTSSETIGEEKAPFRYLPAKPKAGSGAKAAAIARQRSAARADDSNGTASVPLAKDVGIFFMRSFVLSTRLNRVKEQLPCDGVDKGIVGLDKVPRLLEQVNKNCSDVCGHFKGLLHVDESVLQESDDLQSLEAECESLRQDQIELLSRTSRSSKESEGSNNVLFQQHQSLQKRYDSLHLENDELKEMQQELKGCLNSNPPAAASSRTEAQQAMGQPALEESSLRMLMNSTSTTIQALRQAIKAEKVNVEAAERELHKKELSERRAACEALHQAVLAAEEEPLAAAIERAKLIEVEGDIEKAEQKLADLRSMTDEQRREKAAQQLTLQQRKRAFLLLKRDDADELRSLLEGLEEGVRWQDWRDYAGRNMWRCAQELRAQRAQRLLRELLGLEGSCLARRFSPLQEQRYHEAQSRAGLTAEVREQTARDEHAEAALDAREPGEASQPGPERAGKTSVSILREDSADTVTLAEPEGASAGVSQEASGPVSTPAMRSSLPLDMELPSRTVSSGSTSQPRGVVSRASLTAEELKTFQSAAQGAVVRNDVAALDAVLARVRMDAWSGWRNRAGKDLLTLAEERGSSEAYSLLAKALGLITEQAREAFEEGETVWLYFAGEVQPKQATVEEDASEDAETILLQVWDDPEDRGPRRVDRAIVLKSAAR